MGREYLCKWKWFCRGIVRGWGGKWLKNMRSVDKKFFCYIGKVINDWLEVLYFKLKVL